MQALINAATAHSTAASHGFDFQRTPTSDYFHKKSEISFFSQKITFALKILS